MSTQGRANFLAGTAREGRENAAEGFWLDEQAFALFGRQVETTVTRSGTAMLLLSYRQSSAIEKKAWGSFAPEQQWLKRYCALKGNLLFYAPHSDAAFEGAFLLEEFAFKVLPSSRAIATGVVPAPPTGESGWTVPADSAVLIGTSRHEGMYGKFVQPLVMLLDSQKVAMHWKAVLESCGASLMQLEIRQLQATLERERAAASRAREATALITKQQELALKENEGSKRTLLLEIERLEQRNQRLQASGEVTEKAAAEFVDQKAHEVSFLQNELATQLAGSKMLEREIIQLRDVLSTSHQKMQHLTAENNQLTCRVADFLKDLEDARDNPSRFTLLMSRLRSANHKAAIENRRLREENRSLTQNFHQLEEKFKQKALFIRQVAERGEVFDLMRKWLLCSEHKIRFYEQGYRWSSKEEEEELDKIEELQRAIRVAEAAARSSYISHRSFLLGEQLKSSTVNAAQSDVYAFLKTCLDRFGWLFGEVEPYQPKGENDEAMPFWKDAGSSMVSIPLREQIYPFGGLDGGAQLSLVADVCVLRSVEKLVPAAEYMKLKNTHALLELHFSELKEVHQQTVEKLVECRSRLRDMKTQCALNRVIPDWTNYAGENDRLPELLGTPGNVDDGTGKESQKKAP